MDSYTNRGMKIQGESMKPSIKNGAYVILSPCAKDTVRIGDVLAYFDVSSHEMVLHRVIKKSKMGLILKGDNNWSVDNVIVNTKILFRMIAVIYNNKTSYRFSVKWKIINRLLVILSISRIIPLIYRRKYLKG